MRALLVLCVQQVLRSRLVVLQLLLAVFLQYVVLKTIGSITVSFNGIFAQLGPKQALFGVFFLQLFSSMFLAAVYGIWMVPYLHTGGRGALTAVLPISRWCFPLAYALIFLALLGLQQVAVFTIYGFLYGFSQFASVEFPWLGVCSLMATHAVALTAVLFFFAVCSLQFGQVPTFFISMICFSGLQLSAAFFRADMVQKMGLAETGLGTYETIYRWLLPVGELVFDLKDALLRTAWKSESLLVWVIWLVVLVGLFRRKIRYEPAKKVME